MLSIKKILPLLLFLISLVPSIAFSQNQPVIVVLLSKDIKPYNEALSGIADQLAAGGYKIAFTYNLRKEEDQNELPQLMTTIKNEKPDLVMTIGSEAAIVARQDLNETKIVFLMVVNPVKSGIVPSLENPGNNITGVSLDIPTEVQFQKLKEMLPNVKKVGVIYNRKDVQWIKDIEHALNSEGLSLIAKPVDSESDVPGSVDAVVKEADCIWAQVDHMIFNAQSSQYILLATLRAKIPMMAFSEAYVKAGALLALECDYADIGRQSADMAVHLLKEKTQGENAIASPLKVRLIINKKIADVIGVNIPQKMSDEAASTY